MHLSAHLDVDVVALEADDTVTVLLELVAPTPATDDARPEHTVVVVLDRSGSMGGGRLEHAKGALLRLVDRLADDDRFGLVAFDDQAQRRRPGRDRRRQRSRRDPPPHHRPGDRRLDRPVVRVPPRPAGGPTRLHGHGRHDRAALRRSRELRRDRPRRARRGGPQGRPAGHHHLDHRHRPGLRPAAARRRRPRRLGQPRLRRARRLRRRRGRGRDRRSAVQDRPGREPARRPHRRRGVRVGAQRPALDRRGGRRPGRARRLLRRRDPPGRPDVGRARRWRRSASPRSPP